MKVTYNTLQIQKAASYVAEHNPHCYEEAQQVYDMIMEYIRKYATRPDTAFVGTFGFMVQFLQETDDEVLVDVYIDPAVGNSIFFHTEEITDSHGTR